MRLALARGARRVAGAPARARAARRRELVLRGRRVAAPRARRARPHAPAPARRARRLGGQSRGRRHGEDAARGVDRRAAAAARAQGGAREPRLRALGRRAGRGGVRRPVRARDGGDARATSRCCSPRRRPACRCWSARDRGLVGPARDLGVRRRGDRARRRLPAPPARARRRRAHVRRSLGLGNRRVLPRGPLREPLGALARADAIGVVDGPLPERDERVLAWRAPRAFRFATRREPSALRPLAGGDALPLAALAGERVGPARGGRAARLGAPHARAARRAGRRRAAVPRSPPLRGGGPRGPRRRRRRAGSPPRRTP